MWVFNIGRVTPNAFVLHGKRWEGILFQLGNISLTSSRCQEEITWNKVFYYRDGHVENLWFWRIPAWERCLQFTPFTMYNLPFPQSPLCHTTFTFCYAGLGTEIKTWLTFISSLFFSSPGQLMLSKDHWQCISWSDIPSLFYLSCWGAVTFPAELHRTLPRLLPNSQEISFSQK